jgi:hypothetical protein
MNGSVNPTEEHGGARNSDAHIRCPCSKIPETLVRVLALFHRRALEIERLAAHRA